MRLIAHRGNISGRQPEKENDPEYIQTALNAGFDVEIDVRVQDGQIYLGHDQADHLSDLQFLKKPGLWCHAKDLEALHLMLQEGIHCFWQDQDDFSITSRGFIWTNLNKPVTNKSVLVILEDTFSLPSDCYGICADNFDEIR